MTVLKKVLVASLLAFSFAAPALAGEEDTLLERNVYLFMNGTMVHAKTTDAMHAMAMQEFAPMKNGTMIYRSGNKYYIGSDKKLANGQMLHDAVFGKDINPGSQQ